MKWYYSHDGEGFYEAASREDAIDHLDGEGGYIGQGYQPELSLGNFIDFDLMIENAEDTAQDSGMGDPDGDLVIFDLSAGQFRDLKLYLQTCLNVWQETNNIKFHQWSISWYQEPVYIAPDPELYTGDVIVDV